MSEDGLDEANVVGVDGERRMNATTPTTTTTQKIIIRKIINAHTPPLMWL